MEIVAYARYRLNDGRLAMPTRRFENGVSRMVWACEIVDNNPRPPLTQAKYNDVIDEAALLRAERV